MKGTRLLAPLLGGISLLAVSGAQSQVNPERARNVTSLFGNQYDVWENPALGTHAPASPGDPDLGEQRILSQQGEYRAFNFMLTERAIWTNNAALTDGGELSDFYSSTDLRLSYVPQITGNTFGDFSASYAFYRYADHSALDFDDLELALGVIHVLRDLNDLSVWLRYKHSRLLDADGHDELFTDHSVEIGLYYPIPLGARHSAYGALTSEFSLDGNPGYASRHEHGLMLGYKFSPADRLHAEAYYRLALHDYLERGRDDVQQTLGLALTTHLTDRIDVVLSASYTLNDSDLPGGDYEVGDAGALLSFRFDF